MAIPIAVLAGNREGQKLPETLKAGHCHRRFRKFLRFMERKRITEMAECLLRFAKLETLFYFAICFHRDIV